MSGIF